MKLAIIMPVYNEQAVIEQVIEEWMVELSRHNLNYCLFVFDDGSKDDTTVILKTLSTKYKNKIEIINKNNSGHGQTCIFGYKYVLNRDYDWVFQIDSDGQCDPQYFKEFIQASHYNKCLYGYRKKRDDGFKRYIISRFVSIFVFLATNVWVKDANVPYRLMHKSTLTNILDRIPNSFHLANILVSVFQQKEFGINWLDISFRNRLGGEESVKTFSFLKHGIKLFKQLKNI